MVLTEFENRLLDTVSVEKNLLSIKRRQGKVNLSSNQVVVADDPEYETLFGRLHRRLDNIAADPYYSHDFESHLRMLADFVIEKEHQLSEGIALLYRKHPERDAAYWYAKMIRAQAIYRLWGAQMPNDSCSLNYGEEWNCASLHSGDAAAKFFETEGVKPVHVWTDASRPFSIWLGSEDLIGLYDDLGRYTGPEPFYGAVRDSAVDKYIFPQMLLQHLRRGTPMIWDLESATVGVR
jgi:hypothetical protein